MTNKNRSTPGKAAEVNRVPEHGAGNEYGETEPFGSHVGTERVNQPDPVDDREPCL